MNRIECLSCWIHIRFGAKGGINKTGEKKYISRKCHGEIKNIMLDLLNSQKAQKDIKRIIRSFI